ncbi:uncharacterized protein LOC130702761 [Daphnia carinata]|uniref:uncharacterized protein LOC130702761 n=1 Tax=Daphnia carinata TaxID=120202 RepID=UPI00257B6377|nr:uncharacterized protein LOC130702761 [Daphnia carinata]
MDAARRMSCLRKACHEVTTAVVCSLIMAETHVGPKEKVLLQTLYFYTEIGENHIHNKFNECDPDIFHTAPQSTGTKIYPTMWKTRTPHQCVGTAVEQAEPYHVIPIHIPYSQRHVKIFIHCLYAQLVPSNYFHQMLRKSAKL